MGIQQAEPRLEPKKHRRQSCKKIDQSILDELDDDDKLDLENDPIVRAIKVAGGVMLAGGLIQKGEVMIMVHCRAR
ncbi:hypothetical protein PVK06_043755 [Gossypium arboreum]|uniref:Uncharacterized protein n=1 Tax=Gossypium arboreum TaxID=29729 RepID=A0ABR0MP94_GOSAR|nr:hypothetical protein PVK06_043755 [Gossypium arboreum]